MESPPSIRPLSGASLGLNQEVCEVRDEASPVDPFGVPPGDRYTEGGLLGRGGMGEIRASYDHRLGRTVALKLPATADRRTEERFMTEARLTARLEHPGIIAIHDAGRTPAGRPYYTMPIMRGRSLADALRGLALHQRLRLLRHLLDACEAVAYAHAEGIVHRDLKPANIMVGRFGETAVVDWGLAGSSGERAGSLGTPVGTRAYMPPEQVAGQPLTPRSDVYALGVTLRELVLGVPPGQEPVRGSDREAGVPLELLAIADRATAAAPAERYTDAQALAGELHAWFEGRRVAAHRYSRRELLARAWMLYQIPILAAVCALVGILVAVGLGYRRTAIEHAHALEAARVAEEARADVSRHLVIAELAQALEATEREEWANAEVLALHSLLHRESPHARGVLARFDSPHRPRLLRRIPLPRCDLSALSSDGLRIACQVEGDVRILVPGEAEQLRFSLEAPSIQLAFTGNNRRLLVNRAGAGILAYALAPVPTFQLLEPVNNAQLFPSESDNWTAWLAGHMERWGNAETGTVVVTRLCADKFNSIPVAARVTTHLARVVVCQTGEVLELPIGTDAYRMVTRLDRSLGVAFSLSHSGASPGMAAIGLATGGVVIVDMERRAVHRILGMDGGTPFDVALSRTRLAISDGRDSVSVWDLKTGLRVARIPARGARVRWLPDGETLRIVGTGVEDWKLPDEPPWPHLHSGTSGVAAIAISPDGTRLASGHGDGRVVLHTLDGSQEPIATRVHWSVTKDVEFSPDGLTLAAVCAQSPTLQLLPVVQPSASRSIPIPSSRRLAWMKSGLLLVAPYRGGFLGWSRGPEGEPDIRIEGPRIHDVDVNTARTSLMAQNIELELFALKDEPSPRMQPRGSLNAYSALAGNDAGMVVLETSAIEFRSATGNTNRRELDGSPALTAASSPSGALAASGHLDGTISIYSLPELSLVAVLRGHSGRISALRFTPDEQRLVSGSWDGNLRVWSLSHLRTPPELLLPEVETAWGLTLEDALYHRVGVYR